MAFLSSAVAPLLGLCTAGLDCCEVEVMEGKVG